VCAEFARSVLQELEEQQLSVSGIHSQLAVPVAATAAAAPPAETSLVLSGGLS
jgi:hypothetical protein